MLQQSARCGADARFRVHNRRVRNAEQWKIFPSKEAVYFRGNELDPRAATSCESPIRAVTTCSASPPGRRCTSVKTEHSGLCALGSIQFNDTQNSGREYKVELSSGSDFNKKYTVKSDNFKVVESDPARGSTVRVDGQHHLGS